MTALKKYLDGLNGAQPDMGELQKLGVPLAKAIKLCSAAHKPAVAEAEPEPLKAPPSAKPFAEPDPPRIIAEHMLPAPPPRQMGIVGMDRPAIRALPAASAPAAPVEPEPEWVAMSKLHELSIHCESGYSSPDDLVNVGFSKACAEEVSRAINAARCGHVLPAHRIEATAAAVSERINRVIANRKEIRK